jgi:hypothetical protein
VLGCQTVGHAENRHPGVVGQERRQAVGAGPIQQAIHPPLGDSPDLGQGDGQEVGGEAEWRAVEVPA